jgi:hypothetical protein
MGAFANASLVTGQSLSAIETEPLKSSLAGALARPPHFSGLDGQLPHFVVKYYENSQNICQSEFPMDCSRRQATDRRPCAGCAAGAQKKPPTAAGGGQPTAATSPSCEGKR